MTPSQLDHLQTEAISLFRSTFFEPNAGSPDPAKISKLSHRLEHLCRIVTCSGANHLCQKELILWQKSSLSSARAFLAQLKSSQGKEGYVDEITREMSSLAQTIQKTHIDLHEGNEELEVKVELAKIDRMTQLGAALNGGIQNLESCLNNTTLLKFLHEEELKVSTVSVQNVQKGLKNMENSNCISDTLLQDQDSSLRNPEVN